MEIFVARQPIFDRKNKIFGYELLYRSGNTDCNTMTDGDLATIEVIRNSFTLIGIDVLTDGKMAFINFTQNLLRSDLPTHFSPKTVVVEILEDVEATTDVIAACKGLKDRGFLIALDDYDGKNGQQFLLPFANIVKIDFIKTKRAVRTALVKQIGCSRVAFLAEKVESYTEYNEACELGFTYFQGYFFSKPSLVSGHHIIEQKSSYLRIIQELYQPDVNFEQLEMIFKYDMGMSFKLLRLVNSAAFGLPRAVSSLRQALVLLGVDEIRKWATLIAVQGIGEDKPSELVTTALVRAKICEALAPLVGLTQYRSELFLLGMFSLIDIIVDRTMVDIVGKLPLILEIRQALLGETGRFRQILDLILSYESGIWDSFMQNCMELGVEEETFARIYLWALAAVKHFFSGY
jgi:c-di-GMP-related signal transduction protein